MDNFFVVATPIGNLQDITLRALEILKKSDIILCEDTRVTFKLLEKYQIYNKKLISYNDNSNEENRKQILHFLLQGKKISLVSDAGTPLISDPGYKLIDFLRNHNIKITPLPGPSSVLAALSCSGIACENFLFIGFLPNNSLQKEKSIKALPKEFTLVFFETAPRIIETLSILLKILGNRKAAIAKEITKIHEEIINNDLENLIRFFNENNQKIKGEFVIIVEKVNRKENKVSKEEIKSEIKKAMKSGYGIKDLSENLSQIFDINKKEIYQMAINIKSFD